MSVFGIQELLNIQPGGRAGNTNPMAALRGVLEGKNPSLASFAQDGRASSADAFGMRNSSFDAVPEAQATSQAKQFLGGLSDELKQKLSAATGLSGDDLLQALIDHIKNGGKVPGQEEAKQKQAASANMGNIANALGSAAKQAMSGAGGGSGGGSGGSGGGTGGAGNVTGNQPGSQATSKGGPVAKSGDLSHVKHSDKALLKAIAGQESGGNYYGPTNKDARKADGRKIGAIGKYQMLGSNVANWSQKAAKKGLIPQQVADRLNKDPEAIAKDPTLHKYQDIVAASRMGDYVAEAKAKGHGHSDSIRYAAAAWYSGQGSNMNSTKPQKGYPSIKAYTHAVLQRYHGAVA